MQRDIDPQRDLQSEADVGVGEVEAGDPGDSVQAVRHRVAADALARWGAHRDNRDE